MRRSGTPTTAVCASGNTSSTLSVRSRLLLLFQALSAFE